MRGLAIDLRTATEINNMSVNDPGTQGTWKSIKSSAKNNKMKYDINSRTPKEWNNRHLGNLFKHIQEQIFDITLKKALDIIG